MSAPEQRRFRVNTPTVTAEAVDGEVIIVNLKSGTYYSLLGTGAAVWEMLEAGASVGEVGERLAMSHREAEPATVAAAIGEFVDDLVAEGLVVARDRDGVPDATEHAPTRASGGAGVDGEGSDSMVFVAPRLERYIELQNLIQLDPILAVDDGGWPLAEQQ
jgi:Coenzyme PQQ synthesis protein D (PqqD)